jgi:DNA-directed RNA polymerase subunit beta
MATNEQENEQIVEALASVLLGESLALEVADFRTGEILILANRKITKTLLRKVAKAARTGLLLRISDHN